VDPGITNCSNDEKNLRIPATVRIGVTGHRKLANEQLIRNSLQEVLSRIDKILSHTPHTFAVISPLAEGADRLVAKEVLDRPSSEDMEKPYLEAVLPLSESDYIRDFETQESKDEFKAYLAKARSIRTLEKLEPRAASYEQGGHYVVDNCDVLIAIWNGEATAGQGGTAEIVEYARNVGRSIFWINSENGKITEEKGEDHALQSLKHLDDYNKEHLSTHEIESEVKDRYNSLAAQAKDSGLESDFLQPLNENLLIQFVRATTLAKRYQSRHMEAGSAVYPLSAAAVATITVQMFFFSHYHRLLWLEVIEIGCLLLLLIASRIGEWHRKWVDYRFLAERLRAALFLCTGGIQCDPPRPPPYLQLSHRPDYWMVRAFVWIWSMRKKEQLNGKISYESLRHFLQAAWIGDQIFYYTRTSQQYREKHTRLAHSGEILFALTFVATLFHTIGYGESMLLDSFHLPNILASMAIILLAVGASLAGIRVHREYLKNAERYGDMAQYLSTIQDKKDRVSGLEELIGLLEGANELMLRENLDWRVVFQFQKLEAP